MECMDRFRFFAWPSYLVGVSLIFIPIVDLTAHSWPLNPGSAEWRFGAIGLLSNTFIVPAAGLLIVLGVAVALEHKRLLQLLGWLCALGAVLMGITLGLFTLDAIQTRLGVKPELMTSFVVASITAAGKLMLALVTLLAFAVAGIRTARAATAGRASATSLPAVPTPRVARRA
jgi:hypothetical protein